MLEKLLARLIPHLGLDETVVIPETGLFTVQVDGEMEIAISALDQRRALMEAVVRKFGDNEPVSEDLLRQFLRQSTAVIRESQSVLTIDPATQAVVLFSTGNVENMEGNRAVLWLEQFLNELAALRKIASQSPAREMPLRFLRP